jgi:hypothetical protein
MCGTAGMRIREKILFGYGLCDEKTRVLVYHIRFRRRAHGWPGDVRSGLEVLG